MSPAALPPTEAVGVVGCGTMGVGIAQVALTAGHPVTVYDTDPTTARQAVDRIAKVTERLVAKGRLPGDQRAEMLDRLSVAASLADLAHASLVVEAAVEDLAIKQGIFTELEAACADDAVLASNTSSISITAIAAALRRPQRVVGMHFFNPAPLMKLVEVVDALQTDEQVIESVAGTAAAWDKVAIRVSSTPGFVVNRVARPFYTEALRVVTEQAGDPATVDAVMRESGGFRMGPFELMDLIGLDVNLAVTRSVWTAFHYDPRYTPALVQEELVAAGRLGRKSGRGWFDYAENAAPTAPATAPNEQAPRTFLGPTAGPLAKLVARLEKAGLKNFAGAGAAAPDPSGVSLPGGGELRITDGRSATEVVAELGRPVVLVDLALDYATAARFALAGLRRLPVGDPRGGRRPPAAHRCRRQCGGRRAGTLRRAHGGHAGQRGRRRGGTRRRNRRARGPGHAARGQLSGGAAGVGPTMGLRRRRTSPRPPRLCVRRRALSGGAVVAPTGTR